MNGDRNEEILRNYIERITALQIERRRALGTGELQEVAREMGMSDDDLAAAERAAADAYERGVGHIRYKMWDDAVRELGNASAIDPTNVDTLFALATAHRECWKLRHDPADKAAAISYARRCIELDPKREPAFAMIRDLEHGEPKGERKPRRPAMMALFWLGLVILAIVIAIASRQPNPPSPPDIPPPPIGNVGYMTLPVELAPTQLSRGLELTTLDSRLNTASGNYSLRAEVGGTLSGAQQFKIELLDRAGRMIATESIRPDWIDNGNHGAINTSIPNASGAARVRIWVE